jgi:hypothetical protein
LATVKSFLGSRGVVADHVIGTSNNIAANKRYVILNDREIRKSIVSQAAKRYGYRRDQVQLGLYVGRFSGPSKGEHEQRVRDWCLRHELELAQSRCSVWLTWMRQSFMLRPTQSSIGTTRC